MKAAAVLVVTLGLACAGVASASEHVTDLDYLKANRCKGLAVGLGSGDTAALDAMLKSESRSRSDAVVERATEEFTKAKREAAKTDLKDRVSAELNGPCMAYLGGGKAMAAGH
jgi:hypothetical protein